MGTIAQLQFNSEGQAQLARASARARDWTAQIALPFWAETAQAGDGGFCEELSPSLQPNWLAVRRLRVQARQVYTYAHAHELGWMNGLPIAKNTLNFMINRGFMPDEQHGFIHLLNPGLNVKDARRDLYDHAFYLLALAWYGRVSKQDLAFALADSLIAVLDETLKADNGGWYEGLPLSDPRNALRRQNPHMHLLEAFMALYEATGADKYLQRARTIYQLFTYHFFDQQTGTITEFFHRDWRAAKGAKGQSVEPGHGAEWVWLLSEYERLSGVNTEAYAAQLYDRILINTGVFLNDEERKDGSPVRRSKRLWVQTELVRAHLAQARRGQSGSYSLAAAVLDGIFDHYLDSRGVWTDQLGEQNLPVHGPIPTSSFYHIFGMIAASCESAGLLQDPVLYFEDRRAR